MSDNINPYESTQVDLDGQKPLVARGFFTETMITYLKAASPWLRFLGILGLIGAGFCIFFGVLAFVLRPFFTQELDSTIAGLSGLVTSTFGISYIVMGIIYIFPAKYLYNFGSKMNFFVKTKNEQAMETALKNNKSYWKFNGILVIISLAAFPIMGALIFFVAITSYLM